MIQAYQQNRNAQQNFGMQNQFQQSAVPQTTVQNTVQNNGNGFRIDLFSLIQGGEQAAMSFYVPNGQTGILFETGSDYFFVKRTDQYGNINLFQRYKYMLDEPVSDFVTRKEFDELKAALASLQAPQSAQTKEGES